MGPPRFWDDPRVGVLFLGTGLALLLAALVKGPCLVHPWDGYQYTRACYNDIQPLYFARHQNEHSLPYVEEFVEYPVLTGLFMWLAGLPADDGNQFFVWNAIGLGAAAVGTTFLLLRAAPDRRSVAFWAGGPPLALYAYHNWDLLAVACSVAAIYAFQRGHFATSGAALALGASAKMYPALFAPILGMAILAKDRGLRRDGWSFGLGFGAAFLAVNAPFWIANFDLWWATYQFHIDRGTTLESIWYVAVVYAPKLGLGDLSDEGLRALVSWVVTPVFLAVLAGFCWAVWRGRIDVVRACLAVLLAFLILNKVFSVQYALWVLPFFALRSLGTARLAAFIATDAAVYLAIFTFFDRLDKGTGDAFYPWLAVATCCRALVLGWIFVDQVRHAARAPGVPEVKPVGG